MGRVTAPPGALDESSQDAVPSPEQSSPTAFGLLSRAQVIADHLRSEVEAEVAALRAEANAAHDEARRLLIDASNVHEDALSAQRSAVARLHEAQQEAAQLVADASDQATLVAAAADLTSESLLASTHTEADEIRNSAKVEDLRLRHLATTELERVRKDNTTLLSESAARIESHQSQVSAELAQLVEEATQRASSIRTAAQATSNELLSRANAEAGATHDLTSHELDNARSETAELRSTTAAEVASIREAANAEAERVLGDAAEQLHWTEETIASLLLSAKVEADRLRLADHEATSIHMATRRRQLRDLISRVSLRVRTDVAEAAAEAKRLRAQANAILAAADKDTMLTREHARAHAERVITEADLTAKAALERGQRRLDEAENGARLLRERAAEAVSQLQTEAHQHRRAVRDEASATLASARADADTSRAEAREMLTKARAEVKVLADRRDDITAQLGHLSGVIEALAVPEHSAMAAGVSKTAAQECDATPEDARPNLSPTANATTGTR
jgi:cell division septum initiation protein DivIVA